MAGRREFKADLVFLSGNALVPAKALQYKVDKTTGEVVERTRPQTHHFENQLREELRKQLSGVKLFPTKKPVFVSVIHGIHSETEYRRFDLDNRVKTILDAMKGAVYLDDSQVRMLWTHKAFLKNSQESFYRISVKILNKRLASKIVNTVKTVDGTSEPHVS
jgi:Holliday junction resolvase RusA-like endonuclease